MEILEVIDDLGDFAKEILTSGKLRVEDRDEFPEEEDIFREGKVWLKINDVVVVVGDLANSTKLSFRKHTTTSAKVYEAATGGAIRAVNLDEFAPDFIDIQGDGFFALFHGEQSYERGLCAAVTLKTWSENHLVPEIEANLGERVPKTGFKCGMAAGILAAKSVGKPRKSTEPVWAGKPVNCAYKCAQAADRHELIVTDKVWNKIKENDFIRWSCGCGGSVWDLWDQVTVEKLPYEDWHCRRLRSKWCDIHGSEFCAAILDGERTRNDIPSYLAC